MTKDAEAFLPLAAAYRMPKSTPEEARAQEQAVQEALIAAAQAPLEIAETCLKALRILDSFSLIGSRLAVSDAGTGAAICLAALKGARLNVLINLKLMKDEEKRKELSDKLDAITDSGVHLAEITYASGESLFSVGLRAQICKERVRISDKYDPEILKGKPVADAVKADVADRALKLKEEVFCRFS